VAIARDLIGQPAIVLADEPPGNLDQATGQVIPSLLDKLHGLGVTIVVITDDRVIAARMERRIEMLDGRIVHDRAPSLGKAGDDNHRNRRCDTVFEYGLQRQLDGINAHHRTLGHSQPSTYPDRD